MSYIRKVIKQPLQHLWEQARDTIERMFLRTDAELKKVKEETD